MKTSFRKSFLRDLKKLKNPRIRAQVGAAIRAVEQAETLGEVPSVKKMSGGGGYYRVRIGDYRIGIAVKGEDVDFVRVLHRKDIYRYFP